MCKVLNIEVTQPDKFNCSLVVKTSEGTETKNVNYYVKVFDSRYHIHALKRIYQRINYDK